jgi:hypothetical protein
MSPINYEALRTGASTVQVPADGTHQATLDRAALVSTDKGERLVTEWTDIDGTVGWTSWNRFDTTGMSYTRELLQGLGIDLNTVTDDTALTDALDQASHHVYQVRTSSQKGSQGDRWFTSTYVDGQSQGVQESLNGDVDLPIDTAGLPEVKEDIPF